MNVFELLPGVTLSNIAGIFIYHIPYIQTRVSLIFDASKFIYLSAFGYVLHHYGHRRMS